uniref:GP5 n=1 Tax=Norway rat arterivirus TaxID=1562062 RepID=A0A097NZA4_9NIDO|nr:GP5 [Norway rat arterivirus]
MRCSKNSALSLIQLPSFSAVLCLFFGFICAFASASSPNVTKNQIYNLTLCDWNVTENVGTFPYMIEAVVISPMLTHVVSYKFMTTAHFLDSFLFGAMVYQGYVQERYIMSSIFLVCGGFAAVFFICRFVRNLMALRFAWTRRTNFILDQKGNVHPNKQTVLESRHGRVVMPSGDIEPKAVILDGQRAVLKKTVPAERWEP